MDKDKKIFLGIFYFFIVLNSASFIQGLLSGHDSPSTLQTICVNSFIVLIFYLNEFEARTFNTYTGHYDYHYSNETRRKYLMIRILSFILMLIISLQMWYITMNDSEMQVSSIGSLIFVVVIIGMLIKSGMDYKKLVD